MRGGVVRSKLVRDFMFNFFSLSLALSNWVHPQDYSNDQVVYFFLH